MIDLSKYAWRKDHFGRVSVDHHNGRTHVYGICEEPILAGEKLRVTHPERGTVVLMVVRVYSMRPNQFHVEVLDE